MILDWLDVSVTTEEGTAEYPTATGAGMRAAAAYAATLARRKTVSAPVAAVRSDLDEDLLASAIMTDYQCSHGTWLTCPRR